MKILRRLFIGIAILAVAIFGALVGLTAWTLFHALTHAAARDLFAPLP